MAISGNRKDKLPCPENGEDTFHNHDEQMKRFRTAHPRVETVEPKEVNPRLFLIPLPLVTLDWYSQN